MAVETQPEERKDVELEQGGKLTRARLDHYKITEQGGKVMKGRATLVHIPKLEDKLFEVEASAIDDLIIPNPDQPREYFDSEKMAELERTIKKMGQKQAINVVPIVLEDNPDKVYLFIIDGERRFRAVRNLKLPVIKLVVDWVPDERQLLYASLSLNEAHEEHNPIERARSYKKMIAYEKELGTPHPVQTVVDTIGISLSTLHDYLEFLVYLPPNMQDMLAKNQISIEVAKAFIKEKNNMGIN